MINHPQARSNITLDEFTYVQGKRAILRGLRLELEIYKPLLDLDSIAECNNEYMEHYCELRDFVEAMKRSDEYHERRCK
jgi:hypothetical protein